MKKLPLIALLALCLSEPALAAQVRCTVSSTDGKALGEVVFEDSPYGLLITPKLSNLPPAGLHGFHLHEHPNCGDKGMNAGGHFDPNHTNSHQGPYGRGHLGDLPVLASDSTGNATIPLLAPRLKTSDLAGHALMIHAGGDTYSDTPPLGGGGARIGCGVIAAGK
ncbi:superoxide dismutase, Cu, Zn [Legionella geestiana]|uniref:Superoxide dismutase [Cu-Zn] n=1 Tax=Legionella geestiana TaxID=45065 RepID=A0A0W0TNP9_9GAMM|nr:superoxide dismutase family protein [Legionella geestiana]KTC97231.1 superoxide dismutase, Cu, Zn [Legionella geestiana]QBS12363.1 superoxide dismutase [Legionella geestiana]QDQ39924.1 superoxide dismutase [Legionella geestiana]STX55198.1 superoxide dismutase, Cu, Zn [Legionella geestiana]